MTTVFWTVRRPRNQSGFSFFIRDHAKIAVFPSRESLIPGVHWGFSYTHDMIGKTLFMGEFTEEGCIVSMTKITRSRSPRYYWHLVEVCAFG